MIFSTKKIAIVLGIFIAALALVFVVLQFFNARSGSPSGSGIPSFGSPQQNSGGTSGSGSDTGGNEVVGAGDQSGTTATKVFHITTSAVLAAMLLEEGAPTTTNARYVTADDGHVLDVPLDVPGAVPVIVSQTTIPGVRRAMFTESGHGAIYQYLEGSAVKTVHLAFKLASGTPQTLIQFLPDNIEDLAMGPGGTRVAYFLRTASGVDGYTARADGSGAKKIFSLPLHDMKIMWPSSARIVAYTKPGSGTPGMLFSIDASTGAVSPILYGQGMSAVADNPFGHLLYQIADGSAITSYIDALKDGSVTPLGGDAARAFPETCSTTTSAASAVLYCAAPIAPVAGAFIDAWHQGVESAAMRIVAIDLGSGIATTLASPGAGDGGESSNVAGIALAPRGDYASFVNLDDSTLWGIRLAR